MKYKCLKYDKSQSILTITLNRPERMNAMTREMSIEFIDALDHADADDDVRAIVVTGAGRAFCAGADFAGGKDTFDYEKLGSRRDRDVDTLQDGSGVYRDVGGLLTLRIYRLMKPVIAAINGPAVGVGITMTLPMDIRLVAEGAKIGFVFTRRGIVPDAACSYFLPRVVGIAQASEWCLTGRVFSATEARAGGLVRSIHPGSELIQVAEAVAREIAENTAPVSVAITRQMIQHYSSQLHPMDAHQIDSRMVQARGRSSDAREGVSSFLEKRPAVFTDRVSTDLPKDFPWWKEPEFR